MDRLQHLEPFGDLFPPNAGGSLPVRRDQYVILHYILLGGQTLTPHPSECLSADVLMSSSLLVYRSDFNKPATTSDQ